MGPLDIAQRYFDARNRRDPAAIMATFADGGTYSDPAAGSGLMGQALADYAHMLFTAFPDLVFEIVSIAPVSERMVAAQWLMRGTHTGPLAGSLPMGRPIALPGADFIVVEGDKIRAVQGYFDQLTFLAQLGIQQNVVTSSDPTSAPQVG